MSNIHHLSPPTWEIESYDRAAVDFVIRGSVVFRGPAGYEALDANGRSLGIFPAMQEGYRFEAAQAALDAVFQQRKPHD
jgi:hypothetical protein